MKLIKLPAQLRAKLLKLKDVCKRMIIQNKDLIKRSKAKDFVPHVELDNTKNNADSYIDNFFALVGMFPQGYLKRLYCVQELIDTTEELLTTLASRYLLPEIHSVGIAFRAGHSLWLKPTSEQLLPHDKYVEELHRLKVVIFEALAELSIAFYNMHRAAKDNVGLETVIAMPDLADLSDCKRFIRALAEEVKEKLSSRIHTHAQAVDYILVQAKGGDLFFEDCLLARKICRERNWQKSTFKQHSKPRTELPRPKALQRAARRQKHIATRAEILRNIV